MLIRNDSELLPDYILLILLTCNLFNDAVSNADYTAKNNWMMMNNELVKMTKVAVLA
jgi:hypothetical protein